MVGAVSAVFERLLYAPLYRAGELDQVLLTIGLVFMAIATVTYCLRPDPEIGAAARIASKGQIDLGFREFPTYRVIHHRRSGAVLIAVLWYGFERTNHRRQDPRRGR